MQQLRHKLNRGKGSFRQAPFFHTKNMLEQFKQLQQLKKMQDALKQESVTVQHEGVEVTMRGDFEITAIRLNDQLDTSRQEELLMTCMREAKKELQQRLAKSFAGGVGA